MSFDSQHGVPVNSGFHRPPKPEDFGLSLADVQRHWQASDRRHFRQSVLAGVGIVTVLAVGFVVGHMLFGDAGNLFALLVLPFTCIVVISLIGALLGKLPDKWLALFRRKKPKGGTPHGFDQYYAARASYMRTWGQDSRPVVVGNVSTHIQTKEDYEDYLHTDHWYNVRSKALRRANMRCQVCSSRNSLQVHHCNYSCLGEEKPRDVLVMCASCHKKRHDPKQEGAQWSTSS